MNRILFSLLMMLVFVTGAHAQRGSWVNLNPLGEARYAAATVTVNGKVYVIGGVQNYAPLTKTRRPSRGAKVAKPAILDTVEFYDPKTDSWSKAEPLPQPLSYSVAVVLDGKIYVFGGYNELNKPVNSVYCYDATINKWTSRASLPEPTAGMAAVVIKNKIYLVGGKQNKISATLNVYDPIADNWKNLAPMPTARELAAAVSIKDRLYVAGGRNLNNSALSTLEEYNPENDKWQDCTAMPTGRNGAAGFVSEGRFFVVGGETTVRKRSLITAVNEFYDPIVDSWNSEVSLSTSRQGINAVVLDNRAYFPIGLSTKNSRASLHEAFLIPPPNKPPIFTTITAQTVRAGDNLCLNFEVADPENDQFTLNAAKDNPGFVRCVLDKREICITPNLKDEGEYKVCIFGKDKYGSQSRLCFAVNVITNHKPSFTDVNDLTINEGSEKVMDIRAADLDSNRDPEGDGLLDLTLIEAPGYIKLVYDGNGNGRLILKPDTDLGPGHTRTDRVSVEVRDGGNPSLSARTSFLVTIRVPNKPPIIEKIPNQIFHAHNSYNIPITVSDPDGDRVSVNLAGGNPLLSFFKITGNQLQFNPYRDIEGEFPVTLIARDSYGNTSEMLFYITVVSNHKPQLEQINKIVIEENAEPIKLNIRAIDSDNNRDPAHDGNVSLSMSNSYDFIRFNDNGNGYGELIIAPKKGDSNGSESRDYRITIGARDQGLPELNDTITVGITVKRLNTPPVIGPIENVVIRGGEEKCISLNLSDAENDRIEIRSGENNPRFVRIYSNQVCLRPNANDEGQYDISVIAVDSRGKASERKFYATVVVNHKPQFKNELTDITINEGEVKSIEIHVVDADSERDAQGDGRISLTPSSLPSFATFRSQSESRGVISFSPRTGSAGRYSIKVEASDNGRPSLSISASFTVTIKTPPPPPPPSKSDLGDTTVNQPPLSNNQMPYISLAKFEEHKFIIGGRNFSNSFELEVNGVTFRPDLAEITSRLITIQGNKKKFNLRAGNNKVTVIINGKRSNEFSFEVAQGND